MNPKSYTFGLEAEVTENIITDDFSTDNNNPYGTKYLDNAGQKLSIPSRGKITSIPSPYARMHITDIAFRELNSGRENMTDDERKKHAEGMQGDYLRAISHCLDVYEMLFRFKDLDLVGKGISIKYVELVTSSTDGKYSVFFKRGENKNLAAYIDTLSLFRNRYLQKIREKHLDFYKFDFTKMYVFKYKGRTFAATSPFTGFFAKADCNLVDQVQGSEEFNAVLSFKDDEGRDCKLFTGNKDDWRGLNNRSQEFLEFLYLLLEDNGLKAVFDHLFEAVRAELERRGKLEDTIRAKGKFKTTYPRFNFGEQDLLRVQGNDELYIRPDATDCSYLKYLLFLRDPVDFKISDEEYEKPLDEREFNNTKFRWIGAKDFLSNALVILPYDINDNYYAASYTDENKKEHRRCLLPLTQKALKYFNVGKDDGRSITDEVEKKLSIVKHIDPDTKRVHYTVTLTLKLVIGDDEYGKVNLRRDYYAGGSSPEGVFEGVLEDLQDKDPQGKGRHFAFGIYPFVHSQEYENIYKVLFYNDFESSKKCGLKFYYFDKEHNTVEYATAGSEGVKKTSVIANQTNRKDKDFEINTCYFEVAGGKEKVLNGDKEECVRIDFAELSWTQVVVENNQPKAIPVSAIIAPKYHPISPKGKDVAIAIDLGTSNTFIAYQCGDEEIKEISTIHDGWSELTFMHQSRTGSDKHRDDLSFENLKEPAEPDNLCLPAQLCEFIPTRIKKEAGCYQFPIPTVINNLRINGENDKSENRVSLVNSAIPFAYYSMGKRPDTEAHEYDTISNGEFKWFYEKDRNGGWDTNASLHADFSAFLGELLFIVRSHMLCSGYHLEKCTLLWTYPLAFPKELVDVYQKEWEKAYRKYFAPDKEDTGLLEKVKYTNESRTPLYECLDKVDATQLSVVMDIGGGSTDVIGYKNYDPLFVTSFGFAGNALYLGGSLNNKDEKRGESDETNYMRAAIRRRAKNGEKGIKEALKKLSGGKDKDFNKFSVNINTLMNYGFSHATDEFKRIFDDEPVNFMLQFHNAALIYHTAQLCKIQCNGEIPSFVFLTGNGSKLFDLNRNKEDLINNIFAEVYDKQLAKQIEISGPRCLPKAATAYGSLDGYKQQGRGQLKFNEDSKQQVVMLGDGETVFPAGHKIEDENAVNFIGKVKGNVEKFIDVFFKVYNGQIEKSVVISQLEDIGVDNDKLKFDKVLSDSMFFQYIALLMERLSREIVKKQKNR